MSTTANTFASVEEVDAGIGVWARARGWWRMARVVRVNRKRIVVVFRLSSTPRVVRQTVPLSDVRGWTWEPPQDRAKHVPPPTFDQARAADLRP